MQKWLLLIFLLFSQTILAQRGFVFVKKRGFKNAATFTEGSAIKFQTKDGIVVHGIIALVKKDSLYINGAWHPAAGITKIILHDKQNAASQLLLITAGVALSTAGMTLAKWSTFGEALGYSAGIGYGNFVLRTLPKLKRKKYNIGKKFTVQTLDLHF